MTQWAEKRFQLLDHEIDRELGLGIIMTQRISEHHAQH